MAYTTLQIVSAVYLVVITYVGLKIYLRYRTSRYAPSLILSGCFLLFTIAIVLVGTSAGLVERIPEFQGGSAYKLLRLVTINLFYVGVFLISAFTWRVFRPTSRWGTVLLGAIGVLLFLNKDLLLSTESYEVWLPWQSRPRITLMYSLSQLIAFTWLVVEAFSHYGRYKKQVKQGAKLDPVVVNRFLIWGLAGAAFLISSISSVQVVSFLHPDPESLKPFFVMEGSALKDMEMPFIVSLVIYIKASAIAFFSVCSLLCWAPPERYKRLMSAA